MTLAPPASPSHYFEKHHDANSPAEVWAAAKQRRDRRVLWARPSEPVIPPISVQRQAFLDFGKPAGIQHIENSAIGPRKLVVIDAYVGLLDVSTNILRADHPRPERFPMNVDYIAILRALQSTKLDAIGHIKLLLIHALRHSAIQGAYSLAEV
ncbi:MAG: hypothetical protein M1826_000783 [Phylliscum demangeonii]|nr:MAG: hypothetical protein M1826_000783 [Phylliscum demangeonii]